MSSTSIQSKRMTVAHPSYHPPVRAGRTGLGATDPFLVRSADEFVAVPHGRSGFSATDLDVEHIDFASLEPTPITPAPLPDLAWAEVRVNETPGLFDFWVEIVATEPGHCSGQEGAQ